MHRLKTWQYLVEIVSQRGGIACIFLVTFMWYRASIPEIPLLHRGHCTSSSHDGGRGIAPNFIMFQGKTPWVDSACADCPGFVVLGAAPAPASARGGAHADDEHCMYRHHLRLGASDCSPGLAFCFVGPRTYAWICCIDFFCCITFCSVR